MRERDGSGLRIFPSYARRPSLTILTMLESTEKFGFVEARMRTKSSLPVHTITSISDANNKTGTTVNIPCSILVPIRHIDVLQLVSPIERRNPSDKLPVRIAIIDPGGALDPSTLRFKPTCLLDSLPERPRSCFV